MGQTQHDDRSLEKPLIISHRGSQPGIQRGAAVRQQTFQSQRQRKVDDVECDDEDQSEDLTTTISEPRNVSAECRSLWHLRSTIDDDEEEIDDRQLMNDSIDIDPKLQIK